MTTPTVWRAEKIVALTGHSRHRHHPSPVSPGFSAPAVRGRLTFGPIALAASIARTATLRQAPFEMLIRWRDIALTQVEWLISDGATFSLTSYINALSDTERTLFASRVGAGITDLFMNALGYIWRDNAACLSGSLDPHADFIYGGGNASLHGVVLAEAHGSFAADITEAEIHRRAKRKYKRQVKPYIGALPDHGKVIHGYSIAFGSNPSSISSFLGVAQTRILGQRRRPLTPPPQTSSRTVETVPASLALAAHRSNFSLMHAIRVVKWIDWIHTGAERPDESLGVGFVQIPYDGRSYFLCVDSFWPFASIPTWLEYYWPDGMWEHFRGRPLPHEYSPFPGLFVMEEKAAITFLNSLSQIVRSGQRQRLGPFELPSFEPIGLTLRPEETELTSEPEYRYAQFRDGLALLGDPAPRKIIRSRFWSPKDGMIPLQ